MASTEVATAGLVALAGGDAAFTLVVVALSLGLTAAAAPVLAPMLVDSAIEPGELIVRFSLVVLLPLVVRLALGAYTRSARLEIVGDRAAHTRPRGPRLRRAGRPGRPLGTRQRRCRVGPLPRWVHAHRDRRAPAVGRAADGRSRLRAARFRCGCCARHPVPQPGRLRHPGHLWRAHARLRRHCRAPAAPNAAGAWTRPPGAALIGGHRAATSGACRHAGAGQARRSRLRSALAERVEIVSDLAGQHRLREPTRGRLVLGTL